METFLPIATLSPFIKHYLVIESQEVMVNRTLPDTSLVMAFRFKGQVQFLMQDTTLHLSPFTLSGLRKSDRLIQYAPETGNVLVVFRKAGATAFIQEPLHELFEEHVALDSCKGFNQLSLLEEQLAAARNNAARVNLVEQYLLSRLYDRESDALIATAMERIHAAKGMIRMKDLAKGLYISQDAFEKRFRRAVGVSPKQFAYITKMKMVVHRMVNKQSLAEVALDAGYYDQPHFNKDFKLFTGRTPTAFMKAPNIM
ncbi:helix-turn-helix domain-containing protein [Paraflavitalea speifideaquila]|uniref:helix-turn-helix domain-containing protein n=1 Tax=Paraflavitalea speifideaquila TaxID=3076558 RepID=UPI0028ED391E|nr:helix-turn-helix domain-containing protein [Paraflavitalea speifideiaquila]